MNTNRPASFAVSFACLLALAGLENSVGFAAEKTRPGAPALADEDQAALELGRKVLAIQRALENPPAPESLGAVKALGLDTRYYGMVRGWLSELLRGASSIRDASKENTPQKIKDQIAFLEKAIRAIDLEK